VSAQFQLNLHLAAFPLDTATPYSIGTSSPSLPLYLCNYILWSIGFICVADSSKLCCRSGFTWIRIHLAVLDPDPYWECGTGSGSRSMKIGQSLVSTVYFSCKIKLFVTQMSDQDPDPNLPGSAFVFFSWIRIRTRIRIEIKG
jgi:hypothetical protein